MKKKNLGFMQDYVFGYVRSIGVSAMLRAGKEIGFFDYFSMDWIGSDGIYYSLFVPANETQIFAVERILIGEYNPDYDLSGNLRSFKAKREWLAGRWNSDYAKKMDLQISKNLLGKCRYHYDGYGCIVRSVIFATRPVLSISVVYQSSNALINSFTAIAGKLVRIECSKEESFFLKQVAADLGCLKWLEVHVLQQGG